ncbi:MAG: MarR family transcriptional regulator [Clostridiales bacterium]|nr:MarR family transcriptional regulator [Clostridiales bacterium]
MDEHYSSGPGMGTDTAEMDLELMRHMRWCSHLLYHRHNLNFSRNKILYLLHTKGAMTQKALMDELRIQAGSLSEMLSKLEQQGLLEKARCPHDKRNCQLTLTETGREQALLFEKERQDLAEYLFAPLTNEEKISLIDMTHRLMDHWSKTPEADTAAGKENNHA